MAGGGGKGIEWMLKLDANTRGAVDVLQALTNTNTAADKAGRAIDQALAKMEGHKDFKSRLHAENAGWDSAIRGAKGRIAAEESTTRSIKNRTALLALEAHEMGKSANAAEKAAAASGSLWAGVLKGELAMEGLRIGAHLAFEAIKKTGEVLVDALKVAGGEQRTSRVFENMLGKEGGKDLVDYLDKFAGLSEFTDDALKPMAATMLQVGLRGADFRNAIAASADVAATSVDKMGAFSGAIESFTRIARTGKIDNRILGGLALNPHDVEAQLAKDLRMTPEVIGKKLEEGTLKGVDAMGSIFTVMEKKSGKQLGALGMEMTEGLESRMDKLKNVPDEIFKRLKDTQGFSDISDAIANITEAFDPASEAGERLFGALANMIDAVGEKIAGIDWDHVADVITKIVEKTTDWIDPLLRAADTLGKIVNYGAKLLDLVATPVKMAVGAVDDSMDVAVSAYRGIAGGGGGESDSVKRFNRENARAWKEAGAERAIAEQDGYKEANDQHSPSRVWMKLGQQSVEGLILGLEEASPRAQAAASSVVSPPSIGDLSAGAGAGGGLTIAAGAISLTIAVSGSSSSAQDIGKEAVDRAAAALLPALEQFAIQAGLA